MTEINSRRRRVWFITGASSGMGYAAAKAALEHGDLVAATARNTSAIEGLVRPGARGLDEALARSPPEMAKETGGAPVA